LIDARAQLDRSGIDFECSIVGAGPLPSNLEKRIQQHGLEAKVRLLGARPQDQVSELYRQSDLFVLACVIAVSGDRDGMPTVLIEAMATEVPVITTAVAGIPELVHDRSTGLLVPQKDSAALTRAMIELVNDPDLRNRLGCNGRRLVLSSYDIRQTSGQMEKIFRRIIEA
jgi:glycosyltransferase involved in cell wall biosynthesis